jgi:hypothetical protein
LKTFPQILTVQFGLTAVAESAEALAIPAGSKNAVAHASTAKARFTETS